LLLLFVLAGLIIWILQPSGQATLFKKFIQKIEKETAAEISWSSANVNLFNDIVFDNLLIRDQQKDTLLFSHRIKVGIDSWQLFSENSLSPKWSIDKISLDNTVIYLEQTSDSTSNYQFLIDYFQQDSLQQHQKKERNFELELAVFEATNLNIELDQIYNDKYLYGTLPLLNIDFQETNLPQQKIVANTFFVKDPKLLIQQKIGTDSTEVEEAGIEYLSAGDWFVFVEDFIIDNGYFTLLKGDPSYVNDGTIDFEHLDISPLDASFSCVSFYQDTLEADIQQFQFQDVSGFKVNDFKGHVHIDKAQVELVNLTLKTPHSQLGDYVLLKYNHLDDFRDFVNKIRIETRSRQSLLSMRDIEYFVPVLAKNNIADKLRRYEQFRFSGQISGKVNKLRGDDLQLKIGKRTFFDGKIRLRGLPDTENTFIDFSVKNLKTHIEDITYFFPAITRVNANLDALDNINFIGKFTGFPNDFVADGTLMTGLGSITSDLNMKVNDIASYSGDLALYNFDLKTFLNDKNFGQASFSGKVKGQGLRIKDLNLSLKGKIDQFDFKDYPYKDVAVNGAFDRKLFSGIITAKDPNFNLNFSGDLDFNQAVPIFGFDTDITALNLKALNLSKDNYQVAGRALLDFTGDDIDNLVGTGIFNDLTISKNDTSYTFDEILIVSEIDTNSRNLRIESDYLTGNFSGDFGFRELPDKLRRFLSIYFPYRFEQVIASDYPSVIDFEIDVHKPLTFLTVLDTNLLYVGEGQINGFFNDQYRQLEIDAVLPKLIYKDLTFDSLSLVANSDVRKIDFALNVGHFKQPSIEVNDILLDGTVFSDTLDFKLIVEKDTAVNHLHFDGILSTNSDTLRLQSDTLFANIDNKRWIAEGGDLVWFSQDYFDLSNLALKHKNQSFTIESHTVAEVHKNETIAFFDNVNVAEVMQLLDRAELDLAGSANGNVEVQNVFNGPIILGDVKIDSFKFRKKLLGQLDVLAKKQPGENRIALETNLKGVGYDAGGSGFFLPANNTLGTNPYLDFDLNIADLQVGLLEVFLGENVSNTTGSGKGRLHLYGLPSAPYIDGTMVITNAGTTIEYLKTHYTAPPATIKFKGKKVLFEKTGLLDKYKNTAELNGELDLNDFKEMRVDVTISSDKFTFLDTKMQDNDLFYGKAITSGFAAITGPFSDIDMYIYGRSLEGTNLNIPVSNDTELSSDNFFTFVNKQDTTSNTKESADAVDSKMAVRLDLDLTPAAEIQIIFDLTQGDIIRARGTGSIQMEYKTDEDFQMYGEYVIDNGDYLFTLQDIFQKKFRLERGGELQFFGNPYSAQMDLNAVYTAKNVNLSQLTGDALAGSGQGNDLSQGRVSADVLLNLRGTLAAPDIGFEIKLPRTNVGAFGGAGLRIEQLNNDEDKSELSRQVFGLLVFNDFLPQQSLLGDGALQSGINTTVSEFVSNQVTSFLSQAVQEILGTNSDIAVNWSRYDESTLGSTQQFDTRDEIELVFTQKLLNDKLVIDIGGNFDVGDNENSNDQNWNIFLSDFAVQYKMTDDGRYRVKLFSRTDWDFLFGEYYNRAGVSLYTSEEFDNLSDLVNTMKQRRAARKQRRERKE